MNEITNNIEISSKRIEVSEIDEHKLEVKFVICDFDPNKNDVQINKDKINNWLSTLLNQPLVGKVDVNRDGNVDFTGHNVKIVKLKDSDGNEYTDYEFDTSAFGTYTSVGIKEIDGEMCIVATATVWRRFKNASDLILSRVENGTLHSSWEIAVNKHHYETVNKKRIKVIDDGVFIGNCLLGEYVAPAFDSAKVLQVASDENQFDKEFNNAIMEDIMVANQNGGENVEKDKNVIVSDNKVKESIIDLTGESNVSENSVVELDDAQTEVSALTMNEIEVKLEEKLDESYRLYPAYVFPEEHTVYARNWRMKTTEFKKFTYTVENDEIFISEPIDVKMTFSAFETDIKVAEMEEKLNASTDALLKANETIKSLESMVSELTPYKEKFEEQEQLRIEAEQDEKRAVLSGYALKSELITSEEIQTDENIKQLIQNVDENAIKAIIAERFMKKLDEKQVIEKSESEESAETALKVNLASVVEEDVKKFDIKNYLSKK